MILIRPGNFQECIALSREIPEFDSPYDMTEYEKRCAEGHISLNAFVGEKLAGFKIGYDRFKDGSFYSWMGVVLPQYRKQGVASSLANNQEEWARKKGFSSIRLKTWKRHQAMLEFCIQRGFKIIKIIPKNFDSESRIWLEKQL